MSNGAFILRVLYVYQNFSTARLVVNTRFTKATNRWLKAVVFSFSLKYNFNKMLLIRIFTLMNVIAFFVEIGCGQFGLLHSDAK